MPSPALAQATTPSAEATRICPATGTGRRVVPPGRRLPWLALIQWRQIGLVSLAVPSIYLALTLNIAA
jgi:hypothetical protein